MGAWGTGVLSDDTLWDVVDEYFDFFNRGNPAEEIRKKILKAHEDGLKDTDEGPLIWIAIAKAQWDCAQLEPIVLSKVREIVSGGLGLDPWAEQGEGLLQARKVALGRFLVKLEAPNPRPRRPRKGTKRKPIFHSGDCLAVRLEDGDWGAILVLDCETESDDPYKDTYGTNLAVTLHYKNSEMPTLDVFEKREWLRLTHHAWKGDLELCYLSAIQFRNVKDRFVRVGNIPLRDTDPRTSRTYSSWPDMLHGMYLQDRWDRGIRD
jgi:hypothetical protein